MKCLKLNNILVAVAVMLLAVTVSSCDEDDPYMSDFVPGPYSEIVGNWELVSINGTPIYPDEYTTYELWVDGSGRYGLYDRYGRWYQLPVTWDMLQAPDGYTRLCISSSQGYFEYEVYYLSYNSMVLIDLYNNYQLEYQRF